MMNSIIYLTGIDGNKYRIDYNLIERIVENSFLKINPVNKQLEITESDNGYTVILYNKGKYIRVKESKQEIENLSKGI